jgi:phosphatidylserine/phosphatidylglycerophosphate/cardiolipin synthase-like enzyme
VVRSLIEAKRRGVDVRVVLDQKANTGTASEAAMNLLTSVGIPVRTVSAYKIMHDKVIVADGRIQSPGRSISAVQLTVRIQRMCWLYGMTRQLPNVICSTGNPGGMSVLTGVHRTNDHTAHNFSAPTEKMYFTLN